MEYNDLISIILPVYNSEQYISTTIKSVLNQTYKNFELIIVNDGSIDKSDEICKEFAKKTSKIKYFYIDNNGVSNARNYAIGKANGSYVTFIDSDDLYEQNYLEVLLTNIKEYHADIVTCAYKTFNNKIINFEHNLLNCNLKEYIELLQPKMLTNQLWNKIYLMDIIKENNLLFDNNLDLGEDYKFNLEYMKLINKQIYINIPLYQYRITNTGLGFKYRKNSSKNKLSLLKMLEDIYNEKKYDMSYIYKNYVVQFLAYFSNIVDKRNDDSKNLKINKIEEFINSVEYRNKLKQIKRSSSLKFKIMCNVLLINNNYIIYILGKIANTYDKFQKKKKYF